MTEASSEFVQKEPCPACGSRDNLARYSDGHAHCFGCEHYEPPTDGYVPTNSKRSSFVSADLIRDAEFLPLPKRRITEETCRRYGYRIGKYSGKAAHIADYRDQDGDVVAQHIRLKGKDFPWIGHAKKLQLFGQHVVRDNPPKLIITEGELDAMSVYEVISGGRNRWGAVSIGSGAKNANKDISANLQWLERAEEVILMFDNDEVGQEAAQACARLFRPGKCKIATLPLKDASDMLVAGRGPEIIDAIFEAKSWRPEGVVRLSDIKDDVMVDPVRGLPWFHKDLDDAVLGRRYGELDALGAGTGVGKTDILTQQIAFDITELNQKVGLFFLEQQPRETARRVAGKVAGRRFHVPSSEDNPWEAAELIDTIEKLDSSDNLFMYDHFGSADYDLIEETIRFMRHYSDVRLFYIDHLTALAAQADDERKALEEIMARLGGLVKELDIWVCLVSHLTTPDTGKSHEEGGRVTIRQFKGSRAIGFWCHHMFGLERDQQADDEDERSITTFRVLKDRVTGQATGKTFKLGYDVATGLVYPIENSGFGPVEDGSPIF